MRTRPYQYHQEATILWHPPTRLVPEPAKLPRPREPMPHTITFSVRQALVVLLTGALGCSSDLLLPDPTGGGQLIGALTPVNGEQTGTVGEQLPAPLVVRVLTQNQEPVGGVEVPFELLDPVAGTVNPTSSTTNTAGEAVAYWTLGTVPGSYVAVARLVGSEGEEKIAEFHATAKPGAPDTLRPLTPLAQPGRREQQVGTAPQVRVVDRFGNPVPGVAVAWQVTAGEGRVDSPITSTDAAGQASVGWTLGNRIGYHKLTAAIETGTGSPVTFTATVLF
jgi:hypothetical protein